MTFADRLRGSGTLRAFRHRNFRYLWLGQTGHAAALWMDQVARAVLILELTGSAVMLSLAIAARLAPSLVFGLLAGAVADRYNRKLILMLTQSVTLGTHLSLGALTLTGYIEVWHVFATAVIAGTSRSFNQPVRQSLVAMSVPREDLLNAIALNSSSVSFMRIGGGAIAGLLLIPFQVGEVYLVMVAVYTMVLWVTWQLHLPDEAARVRDRPGGSSIFGELADGFRYIRRNSDLGIVTLLALILFTFGLPYQQVFVPLLATDTLGMGDSGVGFLTGVTGAGAFIGSIVIASRGTKRPGFQLILNLVVFGATLVAISLQATIIGTVLLLALAGSMTVTYMAITNSILLSNSDPDMHGRVMAILGLDRALIPLGAIGSGLLAAGLGVRPGLFIIGVAILALSGLALLIGRRQIISITTDSHDEASPAETTAEPAARGSPGR